LISLWIGVHSPDNVIGVVLEDPPLFSSEHPEVVNTFGYDVMEVAHNYIESGEDDFLEYYIFHSQLFGLFGDAQQGIYNYVEFYREKRPGQPVNVFFMPLSLRGMIYGLQQYDPYYGESFYNGHMQENFDHAEYLAALEMPTVLIHANYTWGEEDMLMGAMSDEHAARAMELLPNARLERLDAGHATHIDKPDEFIRIMLEFGRELDIVEN
ncbi:MAG TPA: alpha/beta hydrolase, partial [Anaerolineales bacterium]|nr:alpha/beta hydrolase [Anaerolineales bacterium]